MAPRVTSPGSDGSRALAVFEALSRQGRLAVFRRVVRSGEAGVEAAALLRELGTTGSALTLHLRCLAEAGLIHARGGRAGRFVADVERLRAVMQSIEADAIQSQPYTEQLED